MSVIGSYTEVEPYGVASPERGTFFRLQASERVRILHIEVYESVGNLSFIELNQLRFSD